MLKLKELNLEDAHEEYRFLNKLPTENGFVNNYGNISYDEFIHQAIPERIQTSAGMNLKQGFVPDTYYFLWDDHHIIGIFKIRHYLNDFLKHGPGHIGYAISPEYRGKGYGSKGLALAIEKCKEILPLNETEIYMSCRLYNKASLRIMVKNDAYIHHENEKEYYTRIRIR